MRDQRIHANAVSRMHELFLLCRGDYFESIPRNPMNGTSENGLDLHTQEYGGLALRP